MKKLMLITTLGITLGFTSCGAEDIKDFACDQARPTLKATTQVAIDAFNNDKTKGRCEAARSSIETYKSQECGDNFFDDILAGLDCEAL